MKILSLWWQFVVFWLSVLWPALIAIALVVGAQIWLDRRGSKVAGWHWLWGIILGITMVCTVLPIQWWAEEELLINRYPGEIGDAFAIVIIILLCILVFKRPAETVHREIRVIRPGAEPEDLE